MHIINAEGEKEDFQKEKFCSSLERAGVSPEVVKNTFACIEEKMWPGINTGDIFKTTLKLLKEVNPGFAASYNLKRGIMALGPAGFFFEKYIAALLREYGYSIALNQTKMGRCVSHEIDIVAQTNNTHYMIEAKYRNDQKTKTDVTVVMYAYARLLDITVAEEKKEEERRNHAMWVFTNAKFTSSAIQYAKCMGVKLTGWSYPHEESLEKMIKSKMLFPVTTLPSVNHFTRDQFMEHGVLFAHNILVYSPEDMVSQLRISLVRARQILKEARLLYELKGSLKAEPDSKDTSAS